MYVHPIIVVYINIILQTTIKVNICTAKTRLKKGHRNQTYVLSNINFYYLYLTICTRIALSAGLRMSHSKDCVEGSPSAESENVNAEDHLRLGMMT